MTGKDITIAELTAKDFSSWDEYVEKHPDGTFFHLSGWRTVLERAYGHDTCYLIAKRDAKIVGIIPLGQIKSILFGNALISTPFCVYGGVLADDESIREKLENEAVAEAVRRDVEYLEIRNIIKKRNDWPEKDLYVTFRKEISPDPDVNLKAIPRRQRRMVRQGIKAGLISNVEDNVENFFKIYSTSVRNHGTPVFPKKYFTILKQVFEEKCEIRVVRKENNPVSTVMSFYFRDEVLPYYGGGVHAARSLNAFDFMYWELMKDVCQQGVRIFDYGRSKVGTGSYSFKKNWGFSPTPLAYQYKLLKKQELPEINPLNPKYQLFISVWRHLPVKIANIIGPYLSRSLG